MKGNRFEVLLPLVGVAALFVVWYVVTWRQWVDPVLLPSPIATFRALWDGMNGGPLGFDFIKTVYRTAASTLIAAVIAIPLGILLGSSEKLYRSLEFVIDFFRSTPASAMFPLFLESGTTMVLVSHDLEEAVYLADRVLLLSRHPARVVDFTRVGVARPRADATLSDPEFVRLKAHCLEIFQREVRRT